jgi:hypothetical protein
MKRKEVKKNDEKFSLKHAKQKRNKSRFPCFALKPKKFEAALPIRVPLLNQAKIS